MVRIIVSLALLACLVTPGARAQTADQLNKLSLEALTATPPPGSGGGGAPSHRWNGHGRPAWLPRPSSRHAVWRPSHSVAAPSHVTRVSSHAATVPRHAPSRYTPKFYRR